MITERHFETLSRLYTAAPSSLRSVTDLHVVLGHAQLSLPVQPDDIDVTGTVDRALYFKALSDTAQLAANSLIEDRHVMVDRFRMQVVRTVEEGVVTAQARVVAAAGSGYVVEALLEDEEENLLAYGRGVVRPSTVALVPDAPAAEDDLPGSLGASVGSVWVSPFGVVHLN